MASSNEPVARGLRAGGGGPSSDPPGAVSALGRLAYGCWALPAALLVAALCWPVVALRAGSWPARYALVRRLSRLLARLTAIPLHVEGSLPETGAFVVVANHDSYVDGAVLIAALDRPLRFLVGRVFAGQPVLGRFLSGLGCIFAGAGTPREATALTEQLAGLLRLGQPVASFPEGGLGRAVGLRPFHLGAFRAAAQAGVPVVPVALSGSRAIVPPGGRFPRPGRLEVRVGTPILPTGRGWREVTGLRDQAKAALRALLAEPEARSACAEGPSPLPGGPSPP